MYTVINYKVVFDIKEEQWKIGKIYQYNVTSISHTLIVNVLENLQYKNSKILKET